MRTPTRVTTVLALALAAASLSATGAATSAASASAAPPTVQVVDTVGTEFWTAIPVTLGEASVEQTLYASPTANGTVTFSRTDGTLIETRSLVAGQVEAFTIPNTLQVTDADGVADQGIHILSTAPISVYGVVYSSGASTGYQAFPVDTLGTTYRPLSYRGLGATVSMASHLTVVATADGTTLSVTPQTTLGARTAGTSYAVTLDEGQTYQLSGTAAAEDVTGTLVEADRPVAVLAGTGCSNVPTGSFACNPLLQQMTPTSAWGDTFVSARIATRTKGDTYRVLADHDDTVVRVGGAEKATLDAGEFYEAVLPEDATDATLAGVLIETSEPSFVSQYGNGMSYDSSPGDPMMMSVPPAGQYLQEYVVAAPDVDAVPAMTAYLNLVAPTASIGQVHVDGDPVAAGDFVAVAGSDFSVAQLEVPAGQHSISSPEPVGVNVYELGQYDGFGFTGGQAAESIALPPGPTASPQTSSGGAEGPQSVTIAVPADQTITLVDGDVETTTVTVPGQGTYTLDPVTGRITFVPVPGFAGAATPVTFRVKDGFGRHADATYGPSVTPPAGPQVQPLTSTGKGEQSVTLQVPAGGRAALLSGGVETNTVVVPEGTYLLDPTTNTISFVPRPGFTGKASPVTFRIRDAYDQFVDTTYVAEVTAPVTTTPTAPVSPGVAVKLPRLAKASAGAAASVPVTCQAKRTKVRSCTVTLTARVGGTTTVIGKGTWKGTHGRVRLNSVGRALVATPGGTKVTARLVARTADGVLHAERSSRVVSKRFTLVRTVRFAPESARVGAADRTWLSRVGRSAGKAASVTCVGHADAQGSAAWNLALSKRRAAATCAALDLPGRVRVVVRAMGERQPVGDNTTSAGRALNRRATVTFRY